MPTIIETDRLILRTWKEDDAEAYCQINQDPKVIEFLPSSFTVPANSRSIRVMEKIGMKHEFDGNFAHPKLPSNHKLSHHVLYRIQKK
jgi:RimJ/RimL family protein N-acetyltransferase